MPPIDLNSLPDDASALRKIVGELAAQLQHESTEKDKYRSLLRELLEAQRSRKSEQLSKEQLALFEELWKAQQAEDESEEAEPDAGGEEGAQTPRTKKVSVRKPLASHLVRERIVHDLAESEKRCHECGKDLRLIGEDKSERYEYIPATMKVIEDVRLRLRLHREGGGEAGATDRKEHGGGEFAGAGGRIQVLRSSAPAPAGADVCTAWCRDFAPDDVRVDGFGGQPGDAAV